MPQFRTIPRTIEAEQFDGTATGVRILVDMGAIVSNVSKDGSNQHRIELDSSSNIEVDLHPTDWVIKVGDGFVVVDNDEFEQSYVGANPDDKQEVVFKMTTTEGEKIVASVYGWKDGKDAVRALMHIGKPEVVLEFIKEQIVAGDMSMMTLMNELAAKANPGE